MNAIALKDWASLSQTLAPMYQRYARWLPAAVDVLLVVLIARVLAGLLWALVPAPAASWQPAPVAVAAQDPSTQLDLGRISAAQLFGQYQAKSILNDLAKAPDTSLNLTLLGILANNRNKASSRALISGGSGGEKPYSIDETVAPGAVLTAIFPDRVVLWHNGQPETLRLDKTQPISGAAPIAVAENPGGDNGAASLSQIRAQMLANPAKAQDYIRVTPAPAPGGGGQIGYRIYPGKDRSVFQDAGLHPGDVVTSINGVSLDDPSKSLQLLSDLSNASQVTLTLQRGGETQTVNVNLQ